MNCYAFLLCSPREIRAEKDKQRTIRTGRNKFNTNPKDVSPLGCSWVELCWEGPPSGKWYLSCISMRIKMHAFLAATELAFDWLATHLEPCILQLEPPRLSYITSCVYHTHRVSNFFSLIPSLGSRQLTWLNI